jgi:hypothetical protein
LMTSGDIFADGTGRQPNAVFMNLDFAWDANTHDFAPENMYDAE